jgi:Restriction endonuclease
MLNFEMMNDDDLETSLRHNVAQERKILHVVLEHIREVDARKLHLKRGFPSLKRYLIEEHGYSGSAADRRIDAAQLMKDVPCIAEKVRDGVLNLSQIGEVRSAIKEKERISKCKISPEEKTQLLEDVVGLSVREAQQGLAAALDIPVKFYEKIRFQSDGSAILEITLSKEAVENLTRGRELSAHKLTQERNEINNANDIALALANLVKSNSSKNDVHENTDSIKSYVGINLATANNSSPDKVNKTLTPKTRSLVLQKSDCCEYKDSKTGRRCGSKFTIQVDHKHSRRLGGNHSLNNLQTLCARHNRFKYDQEKELELRFFG